MSFSVLLIDDDASFKKILERRLRSFIDDMVVTSFDSLTAARDYLNGHDAQNFDLVIIDEHLPDGRGVELLSEGRFEGLAVLSVSSDPSPEIPGSLMQAGATYFLPKTSVSEPLFRPLVLGILDRNKLQRELTRARTERERAETVKTLVATLKHEINNPLGAVLGAAFLLRNSGDVTEDQKQAAELVESSGKRIKHVLDELCTAVAIEPVTKADHKVFHIPGDKPWDEKK
jgi:signal transduction histidine kinase